MPSHHQSSFFDSLNSCSDIDLKVFYYEKLSKDRKELGWSEKTLSTYEQYVISLDDALISLKDWKERVHIIPGFSSKFLKKLIKVVIKNNVKWIHWSERLGFGLAKMVNFNYFLFDALYPIFLRVKGYKRYAKKINRYALGVFAIGELAIEDFVKLGIKRDKIKFLPYSIKGLNYTNISKQDNEITFIFIGVLNRRKGISILLKAFSKLPNNYNYKLLLIGDDKSKGRYKEMAINLNIIDRVEFLGVKPNEEINRYLSKADIFVFPTLFDGWGVVLNEALSMGKAIISTNQAGASYHLIKDSKNGFIVDAKSVEELKEAMLFFLKNPNKIREYGLVSLDIFKYFTPQEIAKDFISNINYFLKNS